MGKIEGVEVDLRTGEQMYKIRRGFGGGRLL